MKEFELKELVKKLKFLGLTSISIVMLLNEAHKIPVCSRVVRLYKAKRWYNFLIIREKEFDYKELIDIPNFHLDGSPVYLKDIEIIYKFF